LTGKDEISQSATLYRFLNADQGPWMTVSRIFDQDKGKAGGIYSVLAPQNLREKSLESLSWEFFRGDGSPALDGEGNYLRFGNSDGHEPLVFFQTDIYGVLLGHVSQEFQLFHDLFPSKTDLNLFVQLDDSGNEIGVVKSDSSIIQIKTKFVKQFLAAKQMDLVLFIDSRFSFEEFDADVDIDLIRKEVKNNHSKISVSYCDKILGSGFISRIVGKRIIKPPDKIKSGKWPYESEDQKKFAEFVVGLNSDGEDLFHTSDPKKLSYNPEVELGTFFFLKPVYFSKQVLRKYYDRPEVYTVDPSGVFCAGLWNLQLDLDNEHYVVAALGDLGGLPENEMHHWKSFNLSPEATNYSEATTKNWLHGEWAEYRSIDFIFRRSYEEFKAIWFEKFNWDFFKKPHGSDEYLLKRVRIPLINNETDFEDQISILAKLLVDFLNEKGISKCLSNKVMDEKGIGKLERFLTQENYELVERDIDFLRRVQALRSKVVAHRKSSSIEKDFQKLKVDQDRVREISSIIENACAMLNSLSGHFELKPTE